jgi:[CysO sulfur-carrier protein]-thiocarboxylate-dependent cysteine synthase
MGVTQTGPHAGLTVSVCRRDARGHLHSVTHVDDAADARPPSGDGLRCRVGAGAGWTLLVLEGELDFSQSHTARRALLSLPLQRRGRLALDLRGLTFMDTSGIRLILEAMHRAEDHGAEFALVRGPQPVHDVLELVGLAEQLRVVPDPAALAVAARPPAPPPTVTRSRRARRAGAGGDIVQAIGHTPLVELKHLSPKPGVRIWAKLESHNPTGAMTDRVARALLEDAEEKGAIWPGQTILEPTSGNTGISLAMLCSHKGYRLKAVMPDNVTPERTQLLRMYGADIVYSPGEQGCAGARELARELAQADAAYYMPDQYGNPANPLAHYTGTAAEILEELDEIAALVAALGTGGTLMGAGRRLREELGDSVRIVAAQRRPDDGAPILDRSLLAREVCVSDHEAVVWTRRLLDTERIFAGVSSGAIAAAAVRVARELDEGDVVLIVCDGGWKYLSSGIYTRPVDELEALDATTWW